MAACKGVDGKYYEYPLCMTTHCMVIDRAAFEAADALQYLDEETRTWTTDGFVSALRALTEAGFYPTGIVYCGGQGGDQGTRALVNNLYSGQFTNADHTAYTADSEENIKGLQLLVDLYHFDLEGESLSALVGYRGRLGHCHIASAQNSRLVPQPWDGQDYLPFFRALAAMGYEGRLSLEGDTRGGLPQIRSSLAYLRQLTGQAAQ